MGNWRNRPQRRFFNKHNNRTTTNTTDYHGCPESPPHSSSVDDGVPSWEKKFCSLIGSVPWRKVVDAKKFMYCHGNILNWNDSAGEEAFQNAKKRFWAEINGVSCDISTPDANRYIDEINWNPYIDPEVIKDLEQDLFVPDEVDTGRKKGGRRNKRTRNFVSVPSDGCHVNADDVKNPWEINNNAQSSVSLIDKAQGWNWWDCNINNSSNLKDGDSPWDRCYAQKSEAVKDKTWGNCGDKSWGWSHCGNHVNQSSDWNKSSNAWEPTVKENGWGSIGNACWGYNQQERRKWNNGSNSWGSSFTKGGGTAKGWGDSGGHTWGWKQWDNHGEEPKNLEFRKSGGSWGAWNEGSRKREGAYHYVTGYESTRFLGNGYQTGNSWREGKTKRRVGFA